MYQIDFIKSTFSANDFHFARVPEIYFGTGKFKIIEELLSKFGKRILIVTGAKSFTTSKYWDLLVAALKKRSISWNHIVVKGEPSPDFIDEECEKYRGESIDAVLAIGGGSTLDSGKAISGMLLQNNPIVDYLEGVGKGIEFNGNKIPFIAVPTTSGTGSEATKNAVLSHVKKNGFKKSIRHNSLIPDITLVDPELMLSCPKKVTAACGMDAFTQLLEAYVSNNSSPITDTIAYHGLEYIKDNLEPSATTQSRNIRVRSRMAYASLLSGITLANAGLGLVHGLASPIGGMFDIPHGVVCGSLLGAATEANINKLKNSDTTPSTLMKYAKVGALFSDLKCEDVEQCCKTLVDKISELSRKLKIPLLSEYGIKEKDFRKIIEKTGHKNNPIKFKHDEIYEILKKCI